MSARTFRRGHAAMYGALSSAPIAEIRTRKWTKEPKTNPTEALQKGASKKSKGRKRGAGEGGRMTRSVRQHLDAPLELLSEYPVRVHPPRTSPSPAEATPTEPLDRSPAEALEQGPSSDVLPTDGGSYVALQSAAACTVSTVEQGPGELKRTETALIADQTVQATRPAGDDNVAKASTAAAATTTAATTTTATTTTATATAATAVSSNPTIQAMPMMPPVSNQLMTDVPSDEQLEMVLDDLPMLDADDAFDLDALDPAFLPAPAPSVASATSGPQSSGINAKQQSVEDSSASASEDDASANSGSSMPSVSPQSSPRVMSRSSSP
ncbi:unnamed protein product [Hyaloperonospora brassicae]|uniref:RxLR effector candidate protein n=1 Tax=Hyaloperonospora brassicae TaxID=162125 RepID=A0AAV0SZT4_HYABA|nr:unnamed protein product [Hyaloperonospora brassicae]